MNVQLVPHHMHAHNPTVRVELEERTNLDLPRHGRTLTRPWERCWQGGSARGMTDTASTFWQLSGLGAETRATNTRTSEFALEFV